MKKKTRLLVSTLLLTLITGCAEKDTQPPRVVRTTPENGSVNVDPSLNEISVKFDEAMTDGNWSWAYSKETEFPQIAGQAYYKEDLTLNVLPVKLEAHKTYVIWINSETHTNFKDASGNSAYPFKFTFKTK
jgi:hypothetical protein